MLQPNPHQAEQTTKLIWSALSFSMIIYGFVLFQLGKITYLSFPSGALSEFQMISLIAGIVVVGTTFFHHSKIRPEPDFHKRLPRYILCWAVNEGTVILAFAATFSAEQPNGFFYVVNVVIALFGNILTYPKSH